ncbi:plasmid mobilization protein [Clostridium butyricum]|uniref:plasmid mobilization protein n=1 Tax=Clostridium butyricum TaxID=1492 RepID=UPI002AB2D33F|nr:hypothetical protein [Clostridium butyricum]
MREFKGRKNEEELRTERVVAHVTEAEKIKIVQEAKKYGMDTSTFIRTICIYKKFIELANNFIEEV